MPDYQFTPYFEGEVLRKRPYLTKELCIRVVEAPIRYEPQENNRFRFWASVPELGGRYLRVVTLEDKLTIHNAFLEVVPGVVEIGDSSWIDFTRSFFVRQVVEG